VTVAYGPTPLGYRADALMYGEDTMATYLPRIAVHPDRYGSVKTTKNLLIVIHTSEGSEGVTSATNLANYMKAPGDRQNADGSFYGSSYQYVAELNRRGIPAVPDHTVSYSAAGANHNGIHICIPGKAGQTRDQWLDGISRQYIESAAAIAVDIAQREGIPLVKLTTFQVAAGRTGYCGHVEVSQAFKRSTHTDPGVNFPWDVFQADIDRLTAPEVPPMATLAEPVLLLDSRANGGAKLAGGTETLFMVSGDRPSWARAAEVTITCDATQDAGFAIAWPGADAWDNGKRRGDVNWWGPGKTLTNTIKVPLNGHTFKVFNSAPTHLVVELIGYDSVI
jgi:hypothetical protein